MDTVPPRKRTRDPQQETSLCARDEGYGPTVGVLRYGCDDAAIEVEGNEQAALGQPEEDLPKPHHCPSVHQRFR